MKEFSMKTKVYLFCVILLGILCLINYLPDFSLTRITYINFLIFILLSALSEYLTVNLPYVGGITVTYAIDLALLIVFGIPITIVISILGHLGSWFFKKNRRDFTWIKLMFNLAQFIITITTSGIVLHYLSGHGLANDQVAILTIGCTALVYFLVNMFLVTVLFALLKNKSIFSVWMMNIRWLIPNFLALAPMGYIIAYVYQDIGIWGMVAFFLPLLLARHSFKLYMDMRHMYLKTIQSLASIIDAKDHYTAGHSERVARYAVSICEEMKLSDEYIEDLKDIALLHDIGKIAIPENILNKQGRLDNEEMDKMKTHASVGYEIVKQITFLNNPEVCKYHHERFDGQGYPNGLVGEEIPLGARIIAVADAFDAMVTDRPYRKGMGNFLALKELERGKGTQFDPKVVEAFIKAFPKIAENSELKRWSEIICIRGKMEG